MNNVVLQLTNRELEDFFHFVKKSTDNRPRTSAVLARVASILEAELDDAGIDTYAINPV